MKKYKRLSRWTKDEISALDTQECLDLWCHVIMQALRDANRYIKDNTRTEFKVHSARAQDWFTSADYKMVLALTSIKPGIIEKNKKL